MLYLDELEQVYLHDLAIGGLRSRLQEREDLHHTDLGLHFFSQIPYSFYCHIVEEKAVGRSSLLVELVELDDADRLHLHLHHHRSFS